MSYQEKLSYVLKAAALVSPEDLEQLYNMAAQMSCAESVEKIQQRRAVLCECIPYLDENDTDIFVASARMCTNRVQS